MVKLSHPPLGNGAVNIHAWAACVVPIYVYMPLHAAGVPRHGLYTAAEARGL